MIKYFCDRCGKETKRNAMVVQKEVARGGKFDSVLFVFDNGILCEKCAEKFDSIKDKLKRKEDIFNMTEEEIRLLRCSFKVGDKVITADGRTGTITSICDCDRCKNRGFYEPKVEMNIGVDQIWITDTDKENGFISFYQIGDRVFGNVDTEASKYVRERIIELKHEVINYESQLDMLKKLENNDGN